MTTRTNLEQIDLIDIDSIFTKLAARQPFEEAEIVAIVNELRHFRQTAAYLASCHAANLEGLPKSTSKSARERMVGICRHATQLLQGDPTPIRYRTSLQDARDRCIRVTEESQPKD